MHARLCGVNCNAVADFDVLHVFTDLVDDARAFMAEQDRRETELVFAEVCVQIAATNTGGLHLHKYIVRSDFGNGYITDAHFTYLFEICGFHLLSSCVKI